jgi:Fe2+ transport system protein FeoA
MNLAEAPLGKWLKIAAVGGERSFRRRLLELGLLPGCRIRVLRIAPLGDPLELVARGANLSIRAQEARQIVVEPAVESVA